MSIGELLKQFLDNRVDCHVGEEIPDQQPPQYIFIAQNGEQDRECFTVGEDGAAAEFWGIEIYGVSLSWSRETTKTVKSAFRTLPKWPEEFQRQVELFMITDADDNYQFRSIPADQRMHGTALQLTIHLSQEPVK